MVDFQSRNGGRDDPDPDDTSEDDEHGSDDAGGDVSSHDGGQDEQAQGGHDGNGSDDADHDGSDHGHGDHDHERGHDDSGHGHDHGHSDHGHGDHDHDHHSHDLETLGVAVVTISSSRTVEDDPSGDAIETLLTEAGHEVVSREVQPDDYDGIQQSLDRLVDREGVDAVVTTGGTGVTPDDVTVEAATALFDKRLPGFGELFRRLSYDEIGTRVVATRAVAGVVDGIPVFCLPGSENAVRLGIEEIVLDVAGHLAGLAQREE